MKKATIYHNPRCSKSRQALALLEDHDLEIEVIEYLKAPLTTKSIQKLLNMLKISPHELLRPKEAIYRELGLASASLSDAELIQTIVDNPKLLERPIVLHDKKAVIARPPERLLEILP